MKRFTAIALAALMVLTVFASVIPATAATVDKVEIRSAVFNANASSTGDITFDTSNFAGFFYDFDTNQGTESLKITTGGISADNRTIAKEMLVYTTTLFSVKYKSANIQKTDEKYEKIGYLSELYVPIKDGQANKLSKLLIDEKDTVSHSVRAGQALDLGEGYVLTPQQIDVNGDKVWIELTKNGNFVKDEVISVKNATDHTAKTFIYKQDLSGEKDVITLRVYVDQVFQGQVDSLAVIKGVWQISDTVTEIKSDTKIGKLKGGPSSASISMDNEDAFDLTKNTDVSITDLLSFQVADTGDTDVRFYLKRTYTAPGTYEVRGTALTLIANATGANGANISTWKANNFPGFLYDLKTGAEYEELKLYLADNVTGNPLNSENRSVAKDALVYTSTIKPATYKSKNIQKIDSSFDKIGYFAEEYVPIKDGQANKLSKLLIDEKDTVSHSVRAGQALDLGEGYVLTPQQIDVNGDKVWLELTKNGNFVKDAVISVKNATDHTAKTFIYKQDLSGEKDVVTLMVYIDQVFQGQVDSLAVIKGVWQISDTVTEIKSDTKVGKLKGGPTGASISMKNEDSFELTKNTVIDIAGEIKLKVADEDTLTRVYPFIELTITGEAVEEAPVEEAPVEEAPVEEAPVEEAPVEEAPVEAPVEEAPVEEAPVEADVEPPEEEPGFEAVFAIAGLLAVAFLVRRNK